LATKTPKEQEQGEAPPATNNPPPTTTITITITPSNTTTTTTATTTTKKKQALSLSQRGEAPNYKRKVPLQREDALIVFACEMTVYTFTF
jgi:hypothetical protein